MVNFTRGFRGRAENETPAYRPASTTPAGPGRSSPPRPPPGLIPTSGPSPSKDWSPNPTTWTWEQIHALPESTYNGDIHCVTTWSKLGMTFSGVSVDTLLEVAQPLPAASYVVAWSPQRLHHQPAPRRRQRRQSLGGLGSRRRGPPPRARRPGPPPRPPPVLLEKRQMGRRTAPPRPRRTRLLGAERLPRPGRPLARTALPRRLMTPDHLADRHRRQHQPRDRRPPKHSASASTTPPPTFPASTTSSDSPPPTATTPPGPTRLRPPPTDRTTLSSPSSASRLARCPPSSTTKRP